MATTSLTKRAARAAVAKPAAKPARERKACQHCKREIAVIGKAGQLARHACVDGPDMTPVERMKNARYRTANATRTATYRTWQVQSAARSLLVIRWGVMPLGLLLLLIAGAVFIAGGDAGTLAFIGVALMLGGGYADNAVREELADRRDDPRDGQRAAIARQHRELSMLELVEALVDPSIAHPELYPPVKIPAQRNRRAAR